MLSQHFALPDAIKRPRREKKMFNLKRKRLFSNCFEGKKNENEEVIVAVNAIYAIS